MVYHRETGTTPHAAGTPASHAQEDASMASKPLMSVDISDAPDMLRLAEEVNATDEPRLLRRGGDPVAVLVPLDDEMVREFYANRGRPTTGRGAPRRRRREITAEDLEAFRAAAGGWADVDTDKLIEDIYATREISVRPTVDL
jgi:hypothetical protein